MIRGKVNGGNRRERGYYLGAVPFLRLDLGADQLVGWLHGFRVGFVVAGDDVVQLEAEGHQPTVYICGEEITH